MADYDLYYWPAPFRGQFIRAILAYAGQSWREHDSDQIGGLMGKAPGEQPAPFMGPPLLIDRNNDVALSQMPAIALYLGERLGLIPKSPTARALTVKIVADANDVIDELTLDGGRQMWTAPKWKAFVRRLQRWMQIFAATGERHGLTADKGFLLGTGKPGVADIVTATLWDMMGDRLPAIADLFEKTVPDLAGLTRRMVAVPALAELKAQAARDYGQTYCGGQIEQSLRKVAG